MVCVKEWCHFRRLVSTGLFFCHGILFFFRKAGQPFGSGQQRFRKPVDDHASCGIYHRRSGGMYGYRQEYHAEAGGMGKAARPQSGAQDHYPQGHAGTVSDGPFSFRKVTLSPRRLRAKYTPRTNLRFVLRVFRPCRGLPYQTPAAYDTGLSPLPQRQPQP